MYIYILVYMIFVVYFVREFKKTTVLFNYSKLSHMFWLTFANRVFYLVPFALPSPDCTPRS